MRMLPIDKGIPLPAKGSRAGPYAIDKGIMLPPRHDGTAERFPINEMIPCPRHGRRAAPKKYPFDTMKPGDKVFISAVEGETISLLQGRIMAAVRSRRRSAGLTAKFTTRRATGLPGTWLICQ